MKQPFGQSLRHFKLSIPVLLLVACVFVAGCFTCTAPFYEDGQIFQDARIEGNFKNLGITGKADDTEWTIKPSADYTGKYDVEVREGRSSAHLVGTLFRLEKAMFLDLYPVKNTQGEDSPGGPPSVVELMRSIMFEPRHVAWKIDITESGLTYRFPSGNGIVSALKQAPELRGKPALGAPEEQPTINLPPSTKEVQKYLYRFASDATVFNYKGQLVKK